MFFFGLHDPWSLISMDFKGDGYQNTQNNLESIYLEASKLVLWEPTRGKRNVGKQAVSYIDNLKKDTGMESPQEIRTAMKDK